MNKGKPYYMGRSCRHSNGSRRIRIFYQGNRKVKGMDFISLLAFIAIGGFIASFFIFRSIYKDSLHQDSKKWWYAVFQVFPLSKIGLSERFFWSSCLKESVGPFCAVIRGAHRLDGLRAGALRRKSSFVFITHSLQACYSMRKTRAISYVRARRLRRKGETITS